MKCLSLCPLITVQSLDGSRSERIWDDSCKYYCHLNYQDDNSAENYKLIESSEYKSDIQTFERDYLNCLNFLRDNPDFDYHKCSDEAFSVFEGIIDFSEVIIGDYQKYEFEITELNCNGKNAEIKVKITKGDSNINSLVFFVDGIKHSEVSDFIIGEEKSYNVALEGDNFFENDSRIKVTLQMNDNYKNSYFLDAKEKFCG